MQIKPNNLGKRFNPSHPVWAYPANHPSKAPLEEPGIISLTDGTQVAVRSVRWRPVGLPPKKGVFTADVSLVTMAIREEGFILPPKQRKVGLEIERVIVGDDMQPCDLYDDKLPKTGLIRHMLEEHPELFRCILESGVGPYTDVRTAYQALGRDSRKTLSSLPADYHIDPAAALMLITPKPADVSPNPYIQGIVRKIGPVMLKAISNGVHEHHDVHVQYAPVVAKYLRVIAPLLNVGLLAAPFAFNQLTPRLGEILEEPDLKKYDGRQPHSVRFPARLINGNGGIGRPVVHIDLDEALRDADLLLKRGEINIPARVYGHYADVRLRFDPPIGGRTNHPGRIELCVKDNAAGRIETLSAWGELSTSVIRRLESIAGGGDSAIRDLHRSFANLFGAPAGNAAYAQTHMSRVKSNSLELAYSGNDATFLNGRGQRVKVQRQVQDLIAFAESAGPALSVQSKKIIGDSLLPSAKVAQVLNRFTDASGAPTLLGYYREGIGTPAQWMISRKDALAAQGYSEEQTMLDCTRDRVTAYEAYLNGALNQQTQTAEKQ